jgi:hypothetical protein
VPTTHARMVAGARHLARSFGTPQSGACRAKRLVMGGNSG